MTTPGAAQQRNPVLATFSARTGQPMPDSSAAAPPLSRAPAAVFLYSLVIPGSGQWVLGQRRWPLYLAAEAVALGVLLERRGEGLARRREYRDLAWRSARASVQPRVDPGFEYFEHLSRWTRSGAFDREPAVAGLQPETDPATYNGSIWALASSIFLPPGEGGVGEADPRYRRALEYYGERAYPDALAWDWRHHSDAHRLYRTLLGESDDAFRTATLAAGLLLANHVLSAADAFVSARLAGLAGAPSARLLVQPDPGAGRWRLGLSLWP